MQKETSTREQLWTKSSDLDERLKKLTERNDRLVDDLRDSETAAATANGGLHDITSLSGPVMGLQ